MNYVTLIESFVRDCPNTLEIKKPMCHYQDKAHTLQIHTYKYIDYVRHAGLNRMRRVS